MEKDIDLNFLRECFDVNFLTGKLYWKARPRHHFKNNNVFSRWNNQFPGEEAGSVIQPKGRRTSYLKVNMVECGHVFAHHIMYCLYHEVSEKPTIDHFDQNGLNNSISNLVPSTPSENTKNKRKYLSNISGISGVSWHLTNSCWESKIGSGHNRVRRLFHDFFEACCFRKSMELVLNYSKNHGS